MDDEELISKESEPERLDVNKEVIAKTIANISGAAEEWNVTCNEYQSDIFWMVSEIVLVML